MKCNCSTSNCVTHHLHFQYTNTSIIKWKENEWKRFNLCSLSAQHISARGRTQRNNVAFGSIGGFRFACAFMSTVRPNKKRIIRVAQCRASFNFPNFLDPVTVLPPAQRHCIWSKKKETKKRDRERERVKQYKSNSFSFISPTTKFARTQRPVSINQFINYTSPFDWSAVYLHRAYAANWKTTEAVDAIYLRKARWEKKIDQMATSSEANCTMAYNFRIENRQEWGKRKEKRAANADWQSQRKNVFTPKRTNEIENEIYYSSEQ